MSLAVVREEMSFNEEQKLTMQNSTSQDKLMRRKKKTKGVEDIRKKLNYKKSDNSDESIQEGPPPSLDKNNKITDFFKAKRTISSKGLLDAREKENQKDTNSFCSPLEYERQIAMLQQRLNEKETNLAQLQMEVKRANQESQKTVDKNSHYRNKAKDVLIDLLLKNENYRREIQKSQIEKDKSRLGEFVQRRESVRFVEDWEDGYELRQVKELLRQKEQEKEELTRQKDEMKSKKLQTKRGTISANDKQQTRLSFGNFTESLLENSNSMNQFEVDTRQKKERFAYAISVLNREIEDLNRKLSRLEEERNLFILRLKRYNDEINCRYARQGIEPNSKPWPLLGDRYQVLSLLGKGGFSEVYLAFDIEDLRFTACKIHHLNTSWPEECKANYIKHALRENEIQKSLKHQNIVQLYDTIEISNDSFCTVLEYCEGSDLNYQLKKYKTLTELEAKIIIRQILAALNYLSLQGKKIIHYDLKPQNIMFSRGEVKISDFGLSKTIELDQTRLELTSQGLGTYWYLPPECFLNSSDSPPVISTKVDIWSVGVIMYEMVFGQRPFGHGMSQERIAQEQIMLKATTVQFPNTNKSTVTAECKDFIKKCLTYNMEARWDVQAAYYSTYIQNENSKK